MTPLVGRFVCVVPFVGQVELLFVCLLNGLLAVILPLESSLIRVGPVYRQPPATVVVSDFSARLLGGIESGARYRGSPGLAKVGLVLLQPDRYLVPVVLQLVVTVPLKSVSPQILIASLECTGPLSVSAEMNWMSLQLPLRAGLSE